MSAVFEIERLPDHGFSYPHTAQAPQIDLQAAKDAVSAAPGKVVVVVWPEKDRHGLILLPDSLKNHMKPDVGTVIASGTDELRPGDKVLLRSQAGKCVEGFWTGTWGPFYKDSRGQWQCYEVRMYGRMGGGTFNDHGDPVLAPMRVPWSMGVMAKMEEGEVFTPLRDNMLVEFDPIEEVTGGGIILPDSEKVRSSLVTVVSVGPKVADYVPGDRVWLHEGGVRIVGTSLAICSEEDAYCKVC